MPRRPADAHPDSRFTKALPGRVRRYVRGRDVLRVGERVLLGVSGGRDSLALLLVLARLAPELDIDLAVAHFDHRLRTRREAREDRTLVEGLARRLGLPFVAGAGDVRGRARRRRESIEEAARRLRFDFLERQAKRLNAGTVALGHTRDDRAETVVMHLLRGSGLDGLVGMRPRSAWPFGRGPSLARPLLEVTREETLRYCRDSGVEPREDPTNLLLEATRNRVRHEVLPALRALNPRLDEALCRLGEAAAAAVDELDAAAGGAWDALARRGRETIAFDRRPFESLTPAVRARLLRRAVRELAGPSADLEAVHVTALEEELSKRGGSVSLPQRLTASVGTREVRIEGEPGERSRRVEETALAVPGRTELLGWTVRADLVSPPPERPRPRTRLEAWLDAEAVGRTVVVRSRRPGDRLRPLGLGGERKVQDVLVDGKVPREERDAVPIVCATWGVAWVVGHRIDERAALREGTRSALRLRFRRAAAPENR